MRWRKTARKNKEAEKDETKERIQGGKRQKRKNGGRSEWTKKKEKKKETTDVGPPVDWCRQEHPASLPSILISVPGEVDDDAVKDPPKGCLMAREGGVVERREGGKGGGMFDLFSYLFFLRILTIFIYLFGSVWTYFELFKTIEWMMEVEGVPMGGKG